MHDDDMEDALARMLHDRAADLPTPGDPVGITKPALVAAQRRRRVALSATAVLVVAGGAVAGGQAFGAGHGGTVGALSGSPATATGAAGALTPATGAGTGTATPKPDKHVVLPSPDYRADCGTAEKEIHRDSTKYPDPARGNLTDGGMTDALTARAMALTNGTDPRLVYAGEDATTRVFVVFVNPTSKPVNCDKDMVAVVFHGPAGATGAQLQAQAGAASFGPNFGFTWAERNADGSMTTLVVNPSYVKKIQPAGDLTGSIQATRPWVTTNDGTLLKTYPAGTPVPIMYDFSAPNGRDAADTQSFVVTAATKEAYADAVGVHAGQVAFQDAGVESGAIPAFKVGPMSTNGLLKTLDADAGAESVFWTTYEGG